MNLSCERLRELLYYDYSTGIFYWRVKRKRKNPGDIAGCLHPHGYIVIMIDCYQHPAHRLAWLYCKGCWPSKEIDHKDGDRSNNLIENIREADGTQNNGNRRLTYKNTAGCKGVIKRKNGWEASIGFRGQYYYLGLHETVEGAQAAYLREASKLFGQFARAA